MSYRTIAILKEDGTTRIPRPFNRACSTDEMRELIDGWQPRTGILPRARYAIENLGTDQPVATRGEIKFYGFFED